MPCGPSAWGLAIPLIVVTGALSSEQAAMVSFHEGADDYLLKDRLRRLGQAVRRALQKHRLRRENVRAERALKDGERRFPALIEQSADAVLLISADYKVSYASPAVSRMPGYAADDLERRHAVELLHAEGAVLAAILPVTGANFRTQVEL
jgi:PAS domain-containing protein